MHASQHALFVGPGRLTDELRDVLRKRNGVILSDITIQVPRLLGLFDSAADAERVASELQRLKIDAVVAGPEQPPAEDSWSIARSLAPFDEVFRVEGLNGEELTLRPPEVRKVTILDWRPIEGAADRAVLLSFDDRKPILLRASLLDSVSSQTVPMTGLKRINEVLDALAAVGHPELCVRTRRIDEADVRCGLLTGELLPLTLAVVDAVDTLPGELPSPVTPRPAAAPGRRAHFTGLAALSAWSLYLGSLVAIVASLGFFALAVLAVSVSAAASGLALGAWGTRRFMWSRWLGRATWGEANPIPAFPISPSEPGIAPRPLELLFDVALVFTLSFGVMVSEGAPHVASIWGLLFAAAGTCSSLVGVYESWQRE